MANLPVKKQANLPTVDVNDTVEVDLEDVKQKLAECLDIDPSKIEVGKVPGKTLGARNPMEIMMNYMDLKRTGDVWANFDISLGTDEIAETLNGFNFLENIEVNGCSGHELCGIVSDSSMLAGNLVITSKFTEAEIIPFMRQLGAVGGEDGVSEGFEHYWDSIGGKVIGQATVERMQQQLLGTGGRIGQIGSVGMRRLAGRH